MNKDEIATSAQRPPRNDEEEDEIATVAALPRNCKFEK